MDAPGLTIKTTRTYTGDKILAFYNHFYFCIFMDFFFFLKNTNSQKTKTKIEIIFKGKYKKKNNKKNTIKKENKWIYTEKINKQKKKINK